MPVQPDQTFDYVFLSYASADRERALRIADLLEGQGISVWIDRHSIAGGAAWSAEIVRGVKGCAVLVVLCSPASMASLNVHRELNLAVEENRPVLPLLLERVALPDEVRYALVGRQWVELLDQAEDVWWPQIVRALGRLSLAAGSGAASMTDSPGISNTPAERHTPIEVAQTSPHPETPVTSSPLSRLLARAPLVGRMAELAYLREQYDAVATGQGGRLVFISGGPGTGKTRLAQEVGAYARDRGGALTTGYYLRDGTAAYGPWIEVLRAGLRSLDARDVSQIVALYGADLARLVPEIGAFVSPDAARGQSPEEQKLRLFDGIAETLIRVSQRQSLVVLLDDLQWAPGLEVLTHLARRLTEGRILVLGTYREQDFHAQPALVRAWAELNRLRLAAEIKLHPLTEDETTELVAHYFGPEPAARLAGPVYRRTRGNAFFTEEVLRSLSETGAVRAGQAGWEVADPTRVTIPESMKLAVQDRIARLGEGAQEVLIQAAVLGQEFGFAELLAMTARTEDEVLDIIEQAQAARILVDRSGQGEERYGFWDDQIQEVLYGSISTARRRRYHARAGQALESLWGGRSDMPLEELARHFVEGNDLAKAVSYAFRAAEKNARVFHWPRVQGFYQLALDALTHLPDNDERRRQRIDTILRLVQVTHATDDPARNLTRLAEADALATTLAQRTDPTAADPATGEWQGDQQRLARIRYWMGRAHYNRGEYREARDSFERALAAARDAGEDELALLSSGGVGRVLWTQGYLAEAMPPLTEATDRLEGLVTTWEWILTGGPLAFARTARGDYAGGLATQERIVARARATNDPRCLALSSVQMAMVRLLGGDLSRVVEYCQAGLRAAEQCDELIWVYFGLGSQMWAESRLGDHEAAETSLAAFKDVSRTLGGRLLYGDWFEAAEAEIALNAGRSEEAIALARQAMHRAQVVGSLFAEGFARRVLGRALGAPGSPNWAEAGDHLAASLRRFEEGDARLEAARTRVIWGQFLRDCGDVIAARDHLEKAAARFEASGLTEELERTRALLADLA